MKSHGDRSKRILHLLLQGGATSIDDLAPLVGASAASVRRDLIKLEERGLVERRHGGVDLAGKLSFGPFKFDAAFAEREERFADEKRRIALAAAELVQEGETIALSPGTTTTQMSRSLRQRENIHVVTSALNIGMELSAHAGMKVTLTGGSVRWPGSFSMVGNTAFMALHSMQFDKVFLGCTGLHPRRGLSVIQPDEALILAEMMNNSRQVIGIADSSKLGSIGPQIVCEPSRLHTIVTDSDADPAVVKAFQKSGVNVVLV